MTDRHDAMCERCGRELPLDEVAPACECGVDGLCEDCMAQHSIEHEDADALA